MKQTPEGAFDPLLPVYRKPEDMGGLRGRVHLRLMLMPLAFLAFGIAARGDHQPPQVTTGSAAPLPMEVLLGSSGETATLMTTAGGEFMLNGEAFASGGSVTAGNGGRYTLRLADGTWTAQFDAHEIVVRLGTSGETVTITQAEDGTYRLGDLAVQSGETVHTAANGNEYVLRITTDNSGAITWTATYRAPVIKVLLGTSGDTVRLDKAEDGSHRLGELAITSGATTIMAGNGNTYTLTLGEDGTWMAEYREMVVDVLLGTSGETVVVRKAEDGSYWLGELAVESGVTLTTASNGNQFRLRLGEDGTWRAEYVPMGGTVTVGSLGVTLEAMRTEDGTWTVVSPVSGEPETLVDGTTFMFGGNTYTLSSDGEGNWMAEYREMVVDVLLGMSAEMVQLRRAEDGSYWLDDRQVEDGVTMVTAGNGNVYTLALGEDGMWTALHAAPEATVKLGRSETTVTIVQAEDGTYTLNGEAFSSGSRVTAGNGNVYTVTLADGAWMAEHMPERVPIKGTDGLLAVLREDRQAYSVDGATLDLSGRGVITTQNSGIYRVWIQDGMLLGTRLDNVKIDGQAKFKTGGLSVHPAVREDDPDTPDVNEAQTALVVADEDYPFADLLAGGVLRTQGKNFLVDARMRLMEIRENIKTLLDLFDTDSERDTHVGRHWGTASANNAKMNVKGVLQSVFGSRKFGSLTAPDDDNALRKIDDLITALSSADELSTALRDEGVLEEAGANADDAAKIFMATKTETTMTYGMYGNTRFGTIFRKERTDAVTAPKYDADASPQMGARGGFAFGVTDETARARYVQTAGTARYEGRTLAVSGADQQYAGDIEISINFTAEKVDGLITNLQTADGEPWEYLFGAADSIMLPLADLDSQGRWNQSMENGAAINFGRQGGVYRPRMVDSTFAGRLLGGNSAPGAGGEVVGVWSIGDGVKTNSAAGTENWNYLAGGFGAGRVADPPVERPTAVGGTVVNALILSNEVNTALENGELVAKPRAMDWTWESLTKQQVGHLAAGFDGLRSKALYFRRADEGNTVTQKGDARLSKEIPLEKLLNREGDEVNINSDESWVQVVRNRIQGRRDKIAGLQKIGGLASQIKLEWGQVSLDLLSGLFWDVQSDSSAATRATRLGPPNVDNGPLNQLPRKTVNVDASGNTSWETPNDVLDRIDAIIEALNSKESLGAAFDTDQDGLFVVEDPNDNNREKSFLVAYGDDGELFDSEGGKKQIYNTLAGAIFNQRQWQIKATIGRTDYTRFGVWRIRHARNALRANNWLNKELESFAYSPLPVASASSRIQLRGKATYEGKTVAYVARTAYEGEVWVGVRWYDGSSYDSELTSPTATEIGGSVTTVISNLRHMESGKYLYHDGKTVRRLIFGRIVFSTDDSRGTRVGDQQLDFTRDADDFGTATGRYERSRRTVQVDYRDSSARRQEANLNGHYFKFVGNSVDGPLGIIGQYEFINSGAVNTGNMFGTEARIRSSDIVGAYGADRMDLP